MDLSAFFGSFFFLGIILVIGIVIAITRFYKKVAQGKAMIVNTMRAEPIVTFTGRMVYPIVHKSEMMDISIKTIEIDRRGSDGLICKDNIRADIKVAFFVRVNKTENDVLKVAQSIGCVRASDKETMEELFTAKFSEALKTVGKQMDFEDLYRERENFRENIVRLIGRDLNGYVLDDAAIDYLEQTPITQLDENNILDAQGIRKITQLTAEQHIYTNELERDEEIKIKKKNVETIEKVLELDRQQADAQARQKREISIVQSREQAETDKFSEEQRLLAERARIETEEQLQIREENKLREVEVAQKNRERAVAIETEKVERVKQLEKIAREKQVSLEEISKEKALEGERKAIADIIRTRIVVDKSVAQEEENIKELRLISQADRLKQVRVIEAEAEALEALEKQIRSAEAAEKTAHFKSKEEIILAEAELVAATKLAEASKRNAEGTQAEEAAKGLAEAKVIEAKAIALEKQGRAEAIVVQEKLMAEAKGSEAGGMADVRVKEADAASEEKQEMVAVRVKIAGAEAIEKEGKAEAQVVLECAKAYAEGLKEKFAAMSEMSDASRSHEEYRMELEQKRVISLASIDANTVIAAEHARVLAEAVKQANIDIVGGDGVFLERFIQAISVGKSIDGFLAKSEISQTLLKDYVSGDKNLIEQAKSVISNLSDASESVKDLTITAFLSQVMTDQASDDDRNKIKKLLNSAKRLGIK